MIDNCDQQKGARELQLFCLATDYTWSGMIIYIYTPLIFPDSVIHMYCPIISYAIYWNSLRQVSSQPKSPDALEKTSQKTTKILCEIILKSLEFTGQFLTLTLKSLNS